MNAAKHCFLRLRNPRCKLVFIDSLPRGAALLDVGCGNDSPYQIKSERPDLYYIGLDVANYNNSAESIRYADQYIITRPEQFAQEIARFAGKVDAVISSHNIEHCNQPDEVLGAMLKALSPGGRLYMSFPCEESVRFPNRRGTLNFYDDATHQTVPNWNAILSKVEQAGLLVDYAAKRHRPLVSAVLGFLNEPYSAYCRKVARGTWALYGFESVIWASRTKNLGKNNLTFSRRGNWVK